MEICLHSNEIYFLHRTEWIGRKNSSRNCNWWFLFKLFTRSDMMNIKKILRKICQPQNIVYFYISIAFQMTNLSCTHFHIEFYFLIRFFFAVFPPMEDNEEAPQDTTYILKSHFISFFYVSWITHFSSSSLQEWNKKKFIHKKNSTLIFNAFWLKF